MKVDRKRINTWAMGTFFAPFLLLPLFSENISAWLVLFGLGFVATILIAVFGGLIRGD